MGLRMPNSVWDCDQTTDVISALRGNSQVTGQKSAHVFNECKAQLKKVYLLSLPLYLSTNSKVASASQTLMQFPPCAQHMTLMYMHILQEKYPQFLLNMSALSYIMQMNKNYAIIICQSSCVASVHFYRAWL